MLKFPIQVEPQWCDLQKMRKGRPLYGRNLFLHRENQVQKNTQTVDLVFWRSESPSRPSKISPNRSSSEFQFLSVKRMKKLLSQGNGIFNPSNLILFSYRTVCCKYNISTLSEVVPRSCFLKNLMGWSKYVVVYKRCIIIPKILLQTVFFLYTP